MAGNHMVDVRSPDNIQGSYPLIDVRGHEPCLAFGEDRVAGENDPLIRDVHRHLAWRVAGGVDEVECVPADPQVQVRVEHQVTLVGFRVILVAVREQGRAFWIVRGYGLRGVVERVEIGTWDHEVVIYALVVHHWASALEVVVPENVVYMMLGVDHVPDRSPQLGLLAHLDCLAGQLRRVHHHHARRGNHEARVTASDLGRGEYVLGYLLHCMPPCPGGGAAYSLSGSGRRTFATRHSSSSVADRNCRKVRRVAPKLRNSSEDSPCSS